jgi:hypothetical protein
MACSEQPSSAAVATGRFLQFGNAIGTLMTTYPSVASRRCSGTITMSFRTPGSENKVCNIVCDLLANGWLRFCWVLVPV